MRFSETPVEYKVPPPAGQHTRNLHGLLGKDQSPGCTCRKGIVGAMDDGRAPHAD
jgi:hypothetical protein